MFIYRVGNFAGNAYARGNALNFASISHARHSFAHPTTLSVAFVDLRAPIFDDAIENTTRTTNQIIISKKKNIFFNLSSLNRRRVPE